MDGTDPHAVVRLVRRGFPAVSVKFVIDGGRLSSAEMCRLVLSRRALRDRIRRGTLALRQSDRLLCVARTIAVAEETFADRDKAAMWLRRPTTALAGERPIDLLETFEGARVVETLLGRIAHGIAA